MIKITENRLIAALMDWLTEIDSDELARISGEAFGGNCTTYFDPDECVLGENMFEFEPNENYAGQFGDLEEE